MRASLWFSISWMLVAASALGQLPVVRGYSATQSGMLYYDYSVATDLRDRLYTYTICPDSAGCIALDFNLVDHPAQAGDSVGEVFVKVYAGSNTQAAPIAEIDARGMQNLLQIASPCITLSFTRSQAASKSIWTAMWRAQPARACIAPDRQGPCADVHDICGPTYHENFPCYGVNAPQALETVPGSCVDRPHNATWYRFMAQRDGLLSFDIVPDNGFDDFDWVLLRGNAKDPSACPDLAMADRKLACNYAVGRGPHGTTGMGVWGEACSAGAGDSPYSQQVQARKGDIFFLLIDDFSKHSSGFDLQFNDVVYTCDNPQKDLLRIGHVEHAVAPIDPRRAFSQYTRVLRIDLGEKANGSLDQAPLPIDLFSLPLQGLAKPLAGRDAMAQVHGIANVLIQGLKTSALAAYAAHDFQTPVHYGDLLSLVAREGADSGAATQGSWWNPGETAFDRFGQAVELIVDEVFDKNSGRSRQEIRYIRLLWAAGDGLAPDYSVAVFKYEDVRDLLDRVPCANVHNDVSGMSLRDALEGRQYEAVTVSRSGKGVKNASQAKLEATRPLELESYHWQK
jgi:Gliding motility associated protein GldN